MTALLEFERTAPDVVNITSAPERTAFSRLFLEAGDAWPLDDDKIVRFDATNGTVIYRVITDVEPFEAVLVYTDFEDRS